MCELSARHQTLYSAALILPYVHLAQHWMQHCSCSLSSCPSGPLSLSVSEKTVPSVSSMSTQFSTIGVINPHGDDGFEGKQTSSNSNQPTDIRNRVKERETEVKLCWIIRCGSNLSRAAKTTAHRPTCFCPWARGLKGEATGLDAEGYSIWPVPSPNTDYELFCARFIV